MNFRILALATTLSSIVLPYAASQTAAPTLAASALTAVPPLVPYSGQVDGRTGETLAMFLIYIDQTGGQPLFTESQMVSFDQAGHYKVQLGAANPNGLPPDLFSTGEARWLEVQIAGQPEQPRVLLSSVPYALKAADAATLGGLPASAFALAGSNIATLNATAPNGVTPNAASTVTTTGGTANSVAKFSGANTIVNSILYDNGTEVGIGTTAPSATLSVNGTLAVAGASNFNGSMTLAPEGTATASKSYVSQGLKLYSSAYNSSTKAVVTPHFEWQAEPTGNNTAAPNGTLNLLATAASNGISETGLYINTNGTINFAPGQTFDSNNPTLPAVVGDSSENTGVEGISSSGAEKNAGVTGSNLSVTGLGVGVLGLESNFSATGLALRTGGDESFGAGVWGDSNVPESVGYTPAVMGTADDQYAAYFVNSSGYSPTLLAANTSGGQFATLLYLDGVSGNCQVDKAGDLMCTGSKSAVVPVDNNTRKVALYAVESPENWFEDFGSGQLSNGVATVKLEPVFAQTVNLVVDYHVFLTPNGDSKGLYISNKTATSFEVRESNGGRATLAFDYRIIARRKGYETVRLADKTKEQDRSRSPLMMAAQRAKQTKQ